MNADLADKKIVISIFLNQMMLQLSNDECVMAVHNTPNGQSNHPGNRK